MKLPALLKLMAALAMAALATAGCERKQDTQAPAPQAARESPAKFAEANTGAMGGPQDTATPRRAEGRHMEIVYAFSLLVPQNDLAALQQKHLAECRRLGCEVLSTNLDRSMKDFISAQVSVRIAPDAFPAFEQTISAAPSEVTHRSEAAIDQTLPLLDTEKRLAVKTVLRDRLTGMLREPGQKSAADVAAIERQIAEVQGEIESWTTQLDYLRKVTQTVRANITYSSASARVSGVNFSPVADALNGAGRTFVRSLADLIAVAVWLVPWMPVAALVYWIVRRLRRRQGSKPDSER
jgi:hypothetical protein